MREIIVVGEKRAIYWNFEPRELDVWAQDDPIPGLNPARDTSAASTGNLT